MSVLDTPEANAIATKIADQCQGDRKPGQAPQRYAIIWQAARLGALEAMNLTEVLRELQEAQIAHRDVIKAMQLLTQDEFERQYPGNAYEETSFRVKDAKVALFAAMAKMGLDMNIIREGVQ